VRGVGALVTGLGHVGSLVGRVVGGDSLPLRGVGSLVEGIVHAGLVVGEVSSPLGGVGAIDTGL
jgi:hypothetical protein